MAKNWTVAEGAIVIAKGTDKESLMDLGKRFPLATNALTRLGAGCIDKQAYAELFGVMPEYLTMNKLNTALKGDAADNAEADEVSEEEEVEEKKPAKKDGKKVVKSEKKAEKKEEDGDIPNFEEMSAQKMYDWGKAHGVKFKSTKKADMIALLNETFKGDKAADEDEDVADEDEEGSEYEGKSVKELFKMCKERGIKAEIKKPAKYYIELLEAADADEDEESADDDWGDDDDDDEEEVEEKPAKKGKAAEKKSKPKKDEDDDDWEI